MCGRYSLIWTDDLGNRFRVYEPTLGRRSRFNVAPSQSMPVVVQRWIAGDPPVPGELRDLLAPYSAGAMEAYPVSAQVNSPVADDPSLIAPLEAA